MQSYLEMQYWYADLISSQQPAAHCTIKTILEGRSKELYNRIQGMRRTGVVILFQKENWFFDKGKNGVNNIRPVKSSFLYGWECCPQISSERK
jgi:hypothetical protein